MSAGQRYYAARARVWSLGEADTGKEQLSIQFDILTPDAEMPSIVWRGYFTDKTVETTIKSLRVCGWTGTNLADLQGLDANEVELVIEDETYEGKTRPRVRWVNRPGGLALKAPLSGDKAVIFAAAMREKIKTFDAAHGVAKPKPQTQQPHIGSNGGAPPLTDDDVGF